MTQKNEAPTILIVDDTPSNLGMVVNLLEGRGYRVAIAQDGEEGLQRAQLLQPDLILLDVMMPGADGFEICRRLKELESTRDIRVIFMTALVSTEHKVKGFAAGGVDYLSKPLHVDEVMARVDTHIKLHVARHQLEAQNAQLEKQRNELEQRVAERTEELAKREREFRTLAENQPDNLARYDKHCRIVYWNPQLATLLEKGFREMAGKTPLESSSGTHYVDYQAHLAETIATGLPREMELILPDMGTGVRCHYIRFVAERDEQGEIVGALTIGRDITERKEAERLLHEREQAIRAVVENSPDAISRYDAQLRRTYVNPATQRLYGLPLEKIIGKTLEELAPAPDDFAPILRSVFKSGEELRIELPFRWTNGERGWADVRIVPEFGADGSVVTVLSIGREITERKLAEDGLREK